MSEHFPPLSTIDEQLNQLSNYTTAQLWAIIVNGLGFPPELDEQMKLLIQKGKKEELSPDESQELDNLMDLYDKYVLLRAKTITELQERGENIQAYLQENKPE